MADYRETIRTLIDIACAAAGGGADPALLKPGRRVRWLAIVGGEQSGTLVEPWPDGTWAVYDDAFLRHVAVEPGRMTWLEAPRG